jgi:ADP-heptose:LPS heptosyltransferase
MKMKIKKILVIIAHRGIGDLIYHLPLLRSLSKKYETKIDLLSNEVNKAKEVYKNENFVNSINYFNFERGKLYKFIFNFFKLLKIINSYNSDYTIITSQSTRLTLPLIFSNSKKKYIYGRNKFFLKKKNYFNYTSSFNLQRYSKEIGLTVEKENFFLKRRVFKNYLNKKDIFLSVDSHHNQNNWPLNNFILLTNKLLETKCNIYINFSKNNLNYLRVFKKHFGNDCRIKYTYQKSICEIISIIEKSTYIIGNESGPVCIGATLKKKVHSIYLPIYTKPESKIISNKIFYYNANLISKEKIIKKIHDFIKKN